MSKTKGFVTFSGGIEIEYWTKMGQCSLIIVNFEHVVSY